MNHLLLSPIPLENHSYKIYDTLGIKLLNRHQSSKRAQIWKKNFRHNKFVHLFYVFVPLKLRQHSILYKLPKQHHLPHNSYEWIKHYTQHYYFSEQKDLLNVILYWDKNFYSNSNQSMMGTKTLIAAEIQVYSPRPSNLSETLNDSTNHFFEQFY